MALAAVAVQGRLTPEEVDELILNLDTDLSKRECPKESSDVDVARDWSIDNVGDSTITANLTIPQSK